MIQYHVVGSKGEYEDKVNVIVGVFDTYDKATEALNGIIEKHSNGQLHSPSDVAELEREIYAGKFTYMLNQWGGYNLFDFRILEVPLNEVVDLRI